MVTVYIENWTGTNSILSMDGVNYVVPMGVNVVGNVSTNMGGWGEVYDDMMGSQSFSYESNSRVSIDADGMVTVTQAGASGGGDPPIGFLMEGFGLGAVTAVTAMIFIIVKKVLSAGPRYD